MVKHIKCNIFDSGADIILHQVNCQGVMGSGVAKQVRTRYPHVFTHYKRVCDNIQPASNLLGIAQMVSISDDEKKRYIGNLFAQEFFGYDGRCYTDYDALKKSLQQVKDGTNAHETIAIPYLMGCHRGGGDWKIVYDMIESVFKDRDVLICEYSGG